MVGTRLRTFRSFYTAKGNQERFPFVFVPDRMGNSSISLLPLPT